MASNKPRQLYLIVSDDYLETAFFCGTGWECAKVLGCNNLNTFYRTITQKKLFKKFFRIEKVKLYED